MIWPLLRASVRANGWVLAIFCAVSLGYLLLILGMYDEGNMQFIAASVEALPPGLSAAVGMDTVPTTLVDFAADYFYGFSFSCFSRCTPRSFRSASSCRTSTAGRCRICCRPRTVEQPSWAPRPPISC